MPSVHVLLVDPSGRGGLVAYTGLVGRALLQAGADVSLLGSRVLDPTGYPHRFVARMPNLRFGSDQPHGIRLYTHRAGVWLGGAAAVARTARELRPDVVHFQHAINRRLDHRLLQHLAGRHALVWTAHDVLPHERTLRDRERFARIYRSVDEVVVLSEPAGAQMQELCGIQPTVVEHPVDEGITPIERDLARTRLELPPDERILAAVGFIRAYKGYDLLADVWEHLGEGAPRLLVMGELHSERERAVVARLARSGRVDVRVGFAAERDLHDAVAACDALLLPYAGGSDSGVLHLARALGTPVIASDAPQLAASVRATGSGAVIERSVTAWAEAVLGQLPGRPQEPPGLAETGHAHIAVYRKALGRAAARRARVAAEAA